MNAEYDRWFCTPEDLVGLTPTRARNLIVKCVYQAQHETMSRAHESIGLDASVDAIHMRQGS